MFLDGSLLRLSPLVRAGGLPAIYVSIINCHGDGLCCLDHQWNVDQTVAFYAP